MKLSKSVSVLRRLFLTIALCFSLSLPAFAWNKPGHMVTGAIAAHELKGSDPQALTKVVALLKKHPFYETRWKKMIDERAGLDEEAVVLFAFAARWADDARGTPDHHEFWHFINLPFKPDGQPSSVIVKPPLDDNIENAFAANLKILRDSSRPDEERAKALAWIFHLTGDSHQPLHSTALFTTDYPDGDRGGNSIFVKADDQSLPVNLHSLWDGMIIGSENFQDVHNEYLDLVNRIKRSDLKKVGKKDVKDWVKESFELAKDKAYLKGTIKGGKNAENAVVLPAGYLANAKPEAEKRVVLAGYRLANLLKKLF